MSCPSAEPAIPYAGLAQLTLIEIQLRRAASGAIVVLPTVAAAYGSLSAESSGQRRWHAAPTGGTGSPRGTRARPRGARSGCCGRSLILIPLLL